MSRLAERLEGLGSERRRYTLEALTHHLNQTGQYHRLRILFDDDVWLQARFEESRSTYLGYQSDLSIAWNTASERAKREIEANLVGQVFTDCFRYALLNGSIISIAQSYVPEVVEIAVSSGIWQLNRVISIAHTVIDPIQRIELYKIILSSKNIDQSQQAEVLEMALETAATLNDSWSYGKTLITLAPYLSEIQLQYVLTTISAIQDDEARVLILATLIPYMSDEQKQNALQHGMETIKSIDLVDWKAIALRALADHLSFEQRRQIVQASLDLALSETEAELGFALAIIAPMLSEVQLQQAVDAALAIHNEWYRAMVLVALATQLTAEQNMPILQVALDMILNIDDSEQRAIALAVIAPQLSGKQLEQVVVDALNTIAKLGEIEATGIVISSHDPFMQMVGMLTLNEADKTLRLFDNIFEFALAWLEEDERFFLGELSPCTRGLELLARRLQGDLLQRALNIALTIKDEENQARALIALAPQLSDKFLHIAVQTALAIGDRQVRVKTLRAFAPFLPKEQLHSILQTFLDVEDQWISAITLAKLTPYLSEDRRNIILEKSLKSTLSTKNSRERLTALMILARVLTGEPKKLAIKKTLAEIERLPDREGSTTFTSMYGPLHSPRCDALAELGPQLTHADLQKRALAMVAKAELWEARAKVLVALWPQLTCQLRPQAKELFTELPPDWRAWVAAQLVPNLANPHEVETLLQKGLDALQEIEFPPNARLYILTSLLPYVSSQKKLAMTQKSLEAWLEVEDPENRLNILIQLIPFLSDEDKKLILDRTWLIIQEIENLILRAIVLSKLVPNLDINHKPQAVQFCLQVAFECSEVNDSVNILWYLIPDLDQKSLFHIFDYSNKLSSVEDRLYLLANLVPILPPNVVSTALKLVQHAVVEYLQIVGNRERVHVLDFCQRICIPFYLSEDVLSMLTEQISSVCWDWHWH